MSSRTLTITPATTAGGRWRRRGRVVGLVLLGILLVTLVSVGLSPIGQRLIENADDAPPVRSVEQVDIVDSRFTPASIAVPVGTSVTWTWTDGEAHDVVFADGPGSEVVTTGTWSRTFEQPGEYRYSCTLHVFMDGRVVAEE